MDGPSPMWGVYNYAGSSNCSVGQFGPCGERDGLQVGCYGEWIECVKERCMNLKKLISNKCEICELDKYCAAGLICSKSKCIPPKSISEGDDCGHAKACMDGLICIGRPFSGYSSCKRNNDDRNE